MNPTTSQLLVVVAPLKKRIGSSRKLKLIATVGFICAVWSVAKLREQEERLHKLTARVDKLEHSKGE